MKRYLFLFLLLVSVNVHSQVTSIFPANAVNGQTLLTMITLTSVPITVASPPYQSNDIYLQQGSQVIFASSFNVYYSPPGYADTLTATFTIPQLAPQGLYDVHVIRYVFNPFPQPPTPIDNVLANDFYIGYYGGMISGDVYFDSNQNGSRDTLEAGMPNIQISLSPLGITLLTDANGHYSAMADTGSFDITMNIPNGYSSTTPGTIFNVNLPPDTAGNDFGLYEPPSLFYAQDFSITTNPMRCSSYGYSTWNISNLTSHQQQGTVTVIHSPNLSYNSSSISPLIQGDTLHWNYHLSPFETLQSFIYYMNPAAGDTVSYVVIDSLFDQMGIFQIMNADTFSIVVSCAVDPNEKSVFPAGESPLHLTLNNADLVYTIRFQNTGTDTAYNVVLVDTIDLNLDLTTFQILSSSAPVNVQWDANGIVSFIFNNILLPDQTTDDLNSHGYVMYRILPYANLPDSQVVQNTAYINFDLNAAIATNTTRNMLVSQLPTVDVKEITGDALCVVYPNPIQDESVLAVPVNSMYTLSIYNSTGHLVLQRTSSGNYSLQKKYFAPGIYQFRILVKDSKSEYRGRFMISD